MSSFGANLRREREMRGVPLEEISAATKISVRSLQALEAEDFSKLPGGIFTRSFIRTYARYLGLDEENVIGEFQAISPPVEEADLSRLAPSKPKAPRERTRAPYMVILLATILLGGGYALFRYSRRVIESQSIATNSTPIKSTTAQVSQPEAVPSAPSSGAAPNPTPGVSPSEAVLPASNPAGTAATSAPDASKTTLATASSTPSTSKVGGSVNNMTLQVAATEQAWVAVDADGKMAFQRLLKPNDIQTVSAGKSFDVFTGNAQGIILTLNGETLKPLGRHGEEKKVHLTRDDLKSIAP